MFVQLYRIKIPISLLRLPPIVDPPFKISHKYLEKWFLIGVILYHDKDDDYIDQPN